MTEFSTAHLPTEADVVAPDGSDVRILLALGGGSMAHFELASGKTSLAVQHRTVEEIWFFLRGTGEMWRRQGSREETVTVKSGVCLTIPLGTAFQFRSLGGEPLTAVAVTMPPWPGDSEAYPVSGPW
jgi:mannose-6-phosphate isomerase-like protein (cupin superfamily)